MKITKTLFKWVLLSFVIITSVTGILTVLTAFINSDYTSLAPYMTSCVTATVGISGIISANRIASKWREQKAFDLNKELLFETLDKLNELQDNLFDMDTFNLLLYQFKCFIKEVEPLLLKLEKDEVIEQLKHVPNMLHGQLQLTNRIKKINLMRTYSQISSRLESYENLYNMKFSLKDSNQKEVHAIEKLGKLIDVSEALHKQMMMICNKYDQKTLQFEDIEGVPLYVDRLVETISKKLAQYNDLTEVNNLIKTSYQETISTKNYILKYYKEKYS